MLSERLCLAGCELQCPNAAQRRAAVAVAQRGLFALVAVVPRSKQELQRTSEQKTPKNKALLLLRVSHGHRPCQQQRQTKCEPNKEEEYLESEVSKNGSRTSCGCSPGRNLSTAATPEQKCEPNKEKECLQTDLKNN